MLVTNYYITAVSLIDTLMYYFLGLKLSNYKQCRHQTAPNSNEFLSYFLFLCSLFSCISSPSFPLSIFVQLYSLNCWKLLCGWHWCVNERVEVCVSEDQFDKSYCYAASKWPLAWEWPRSDVVIVEPLYKNCYVSVYHIYFESQCHPSALWGQKQKKTGGWSMIH